MLHEHQQQLRRRVERVRVEKARQHEEWYEDIKGMLPTPQRSRNTSAAASRNGSRNASRNASVPASPHKLPASPAVDRQRQLSELGTMEPPPPMPSSSPARGTPTRSGRVEMDSPQRSSLESLAELESLLEEQHQQLVARGFIPSEQRWRAN